MMGVTRANFYLSWIITQGIVGFLSALLVVLMSLSLFEYSNKFFIFLYFLFYAWSLIPYCLIVTALFSKASTAATWGSLFFIGTSFIRLAVSSFGVSKTTMFLSAFVPSIAFSQGFAVIAQLEANEVGVTLATVGSTVNGTTFGRVLGMYLLGTLLLTLVFLYLDRVMPSEYGQRLHPLFFLFPQWWRRGQHRYQTLGGASEEDVELGPLASASHVEPLSDEQASLVRGGKSISVRNLCKLYGNKVAIESLTVDVFVGQVTTLLGHNGAGKTTLLGILTGLLEASSGEGSVLGCDIGREMDKIRRSLGFCPQQNVLFPELTVLEHLMLFSRIKTGDTLKGSALREHCLKVATEIGLADKVATHSSKLSGGQKRKLCVGNAVVGDGDVILMDEPSSGMDPTARHNLWDYILRLRRNPRKLIILCTHYMEEAEAVSDRVVMLADGHVACAGSPLFLKRFYNVGYSLSVVAEPGFEELPENCRTVVRSAVPDAKEVI